MGYMLEGKLLEACSCGGLCPCWVGDDPDTGSCYSLNVYHYDRGAINGVDVSGLTLAFVCIIPGNVLKGNWKVAAYVDGNATPEQKEAILAAHTGKLGGPLADLAQLVSDVVGVYDGPIALGMKGGEGTSRGGGAAAAQRPPCTGAPGRPAQPRRP